LVLKLVKRLLDAGVSLQQIRIAVEQLHEAGVSDLSNTTLMSDGVTVYLCTSQDEVIDLLGQGQGVFGIAIGRVLREVEATLVDFAAEEAQVQDELALRRARKIS
jgi:DNA-binding transcriptional MerR regulator